MAMPVRVVALGAMVVAVGCGSPDGPYVPELCDDTFRLDRAGVRAWSSGDVQITQADESASDLCDHGLSWCEPGWILLVPPEYQTPGVYVWSYGEEPWTGCWDCIGWEGDDDEGSAGVEPDEGATIEITAIDEEHIAGCVVADPEGTCVTENIRFDVPCPADSR